MRIGSRATLAAVLMICAGSVQAGPEDEVKAQFSKFVAAQNAHDLKAVGDMLLDSPQFLWITRGVSGHVVSRSQDRRTQGVRGSAGGGPTLRPDYLHDRSGWPDCPTRPLPHEPDPGQDLRGLEGIECAADPGANAVT
jgi:hypothetical protein